jgi:hypothetical protein
MPVMPIKSGMAVLNTGILFIGTPLLCLFMIGFFQGAEMPKASQPL